MGLSTGCCASKAPRRPARQNGVPPTPTARSGHRSRAGAHEDPLRRPLLGRRGAPAATDENPYRTR